MKKEKLSLVILLMFVLFNTDVFAQGSIIVTGNSRMNISSGTTVVIPGNLTINSSSIVSLSGNLTISGNLVNASSSGFVITSDATCTGSLIVNGAAGDASTQRYLAEATWDDWEDGWHFVSSPVADYPIQGNFTVDPAANYDFYAWSEANNLWINFKTGNNPSFLSVNGSNNFKLGSGYMAAYEATSIKSFDGEINVGDVEITGLTITGSKDTYYSWHLLGNPFTSALTWDATDDWGITNIAGTAQIWNEEGKSYSQITAGNVIPATNGFMVQANGGTGSLTIPKSKRVHSTQAFYKSSNFPFIKLKAHNLDKPSFQESQILFNPESTPGYEMEFDCDFLTGYAPRFYSYCYERNLCVNSLPEYNESLKIPFVFIKNEGLNFSIEMYEATNIDFDVWLLDKKANTEQNLSQNPTYIFTSFENDDIERFEISFNNTVGIDETIKEFSNIQIWSSKKTINILNPEHKKGIIRILNMYGQKLIEAKLNGNNKQQILINVSAGNYIVNLISNKGLISKKVFIGN